MHGWYLQKKYDMPLEAQTHIQESMCNVSLPLSLDTHEHMLVPRYCVGPGITRKMTVIRVMCLTIWVS
jgi:hypothetical protein